jgi:hypothetical protein
VAASVQLAGDVSQAHEDDAGSIRFTNLRDSQFDTLRLRVARALLEK